MTITDDPDDYYRAIEAEFNRRRGAPLLLSPRDWSLIGEWQTAGVPIQIVLQGITNIFDAGERRPPTSRKINSLSYCRQEVLGLFEIYIGLRGAGAGRPGAGPDERPDPGRAISRHLNRLGRRVRAAMATASEEQRDALVGALALAAAELKRLRFEAKSGALPPDRLEEELGVIDGALLDTAKATLEPEFLRTIDEECDAAMKNRREGMTGEAFEATRQALYLRHLRQRCGLPRLTLFD